MELERKAEDIVDQIEMHNFLDEFNQKLGRELSDLYRDEHKLKLLDLVSKQMQRELDNHHSDGSCAKNYPNGGCPTDIKYESGFSYIEQKYDKIVDDINVYGTLNRYNAHIYGQQFTSAEKQQIVEGIERLLSGQVSLAEGQLEMSEQLSTGLTELKELLFVLNKKHWTDNLRGQIFSSIIGLGINTENAEDLIHAIEKSIGV